MLTIQNQTGGFVFDFSLILFQFSLFIVYKIQKIVNPTLYIL